MNIIIRLPTDNIDKIKHFTEAMTYGEFVIIPSDIPILIKDKDGYWHEIKGENEK